MACHLWSGLCKYLMDEDGYEIEAYDESVQYVFIYMEALVVASFQTKRWEEKEQQRT